MVSKNKLAHLVKTYSFAPYMKWTGNPAVTPMYKLYITVLPPVINPKTFFFLGTSTIAKSLPHPTSSPHVLSTVSIMYHLFTTYIFITHLRNILLCTYGLREHRLLSHITKIVEIYQQRCQSRLLR